MHHTNNNSISISPNPVFDALRVELNTNEVILKGIIYNAAGVKIYESKTFLNNTLVVDTKAFSAEFILLLCIQQVGFTIKG